MQEGEPDSMSQRDCPWLRQSETPSDYDGTMALDSIEKKQDLPEDLMATFTTDESIDGKQDIEETQATYDGIFDTQQGGTEQKDEKPGAAM
jgi:hypothetical protein